MKGRSGVRAGGGAALVAALMMTTGCSRAVQVPPQAIEDARLATRVKTALVNDPQLGTRIIEVRVDQGVATLSGLVASDVERARAVELAEAVPGVVAVRSQLTVGTVEASPRLEAASAGRPPPPRDPDDLPSAAERRLLAVGAALGIRNPAETDLSSTATLGPMVRIGRGRGLGLDIGFSWFQSDLTAPDSGDDLGRIKLRPVMGGLAYTFTDQVRWSLGLSLVGGLAFNSVDVEETRVRAGQVVDMDNSLATRVGASFWYDLSSRVALNVFGGYLVTRPQTTFLENGAFTRRVVRADTAIVNVGVAYKLF